MLCRNNNLGSETLSLVMRQCHLLTEVCNPLSGLLSVLGESLAELHHGSRSPVAPHPMAALLLLCLIVAACR